MFHHHTSWLRPIYLAFQGVFGGSHLGADVFSKDDPPPLLDKIRGILLRVWDPLLIQEFPGASDQYDGYAREIYEMIEASASAAEIAHLLGRVQTATMGLFLTAEHNDRVAERIITAAGETRGPRPRQ